MKTTIKKLGLDSESDELSLHEAAQIIKSGGLVAFPTETVYGLGANALDESASKKIYEAKGRPSDNPLIVHISCEDSLEGIAKNISAEAVKLMKAFWPGALTLIFEKKDTIPDIISGGLKTVAVRMPSNDIALKLIEKAGVPIAAPSANSSSKPSPILAEHVFEDLNGKIPMILDGGKTHFGLESTIVDTTGGRFTLLRPGAVTVEMIEEVVGKIQVFTYSVSEEEAPPAPGMKYKHYSPKAEVYIVSGSGENVAKYISRELSRKECKSAAILTEETFKICNGLENVFSLGDFSKEDFGNEIFGILRKADEIGAVKVFAEEVCEKAMGLAVMNRLKKAAGHRVIKV